MYNNLSANVLSLIHYTLELVNNLTDDDSFDQDSCQQILNMADQHSGNKYNTLVVEKVLNL